MSNERNQIGRRTAGNANLLSILGDLLSSDGIQALRVPLGTPGQFLGVDLTQECGLGWQTPGGGGSLTFSDGLTRTLDNVTNDLVIGTPVAQLQAIVPLSDTNSLIGIATSGEVTIRGGADGAGDLAVDVLGGPVLVSGSSSLGLSGGAGNATMTNSTNSRFRVTGAGGLDLLTTVPGQGFELNVTGAGGDFQVEVNDQINMIANNGHIQLTSNGAGAITLETPGGGQILIHATGEILELTGSGIRIVSDVASQLVLGSGANTLINPSGSLIATVGGTTTFDTTGDTLIRSDGASGITLNARNGDAVLEGGATDGTGAVRLQPGTTSATRTFTIFNGTGAGQRNGVIGPAGGVVVDAEMRAAFNIMLDYFFDWGWISNPSP